MSFVFQTDLQIIIIIFSNFAVAVLVANDKEQKDEGGCEHDQKDDCPPGQAFRISTYTVKAFVGLTFNMFFTNFSRTFPLKRPIYTSIDWLNKQ